MSDRTSVSLRVLTEHLNMVNAILQEDYTPADSADSDPNGFTLLEFSEVSYGDLEFLPKLRAQGIPYDSSWSSGFEFTAGTEYCRFTDTGETEIKEVYVEDLNPPLEVLESLLGLPSILVEFIKEHRLKITPLHWGTQSEYSRRYLARQLIMA